MIEQYNFGLLTISGKHYFSDLKIINGQVYPDWWRKTGHSVDIEDVSDIINAEPDYLVIGSGKFGIMKVSDRLKERLDKCGIEIIVEHTSIATETFNRMYDEGKNVAGAD